MDELGAGEAEQVSSTDKLKLRRQMELVAGGGAVIGTRGRERGQRRTWQVTEAGRSNEPEAEANTDSGSYR